MDSNNNGINDSQERRVEMRLAIAGSITGIIGAGAGLVFKEAIIFKWSVLLILGSFACFQSTSVTKYIKGLM